MMTPRTLLLLVSAALGLAACPGRIDDPSAFLGVAGDSSVVSCTIGVSAVEAQIIRPRCATAGCHERSMPAGRLDLESANLGARLVNVRASGCMGQVLVSPTSPGQSYFIEKLNASPRCGDRMPLGSPALTPSEVVCVRLWAETLVSDAGAPMDATPDAVSPDVADVRDVADAGDVRDAMDASDVADAGDAMDASDVADADDAMDASDVADASEGGAMDAADGGDAGVPGDARDAGDAAVDVRDASDAADASVDVRDAGDAADASVDVRDAGDAPDASDAADGGGDASTD
jgi:hypothetical protein